MHAVLAPRIVVHVHCVETLAWAIRADAAEALAGLPWAYVPYCQPGTPLTAGLQRDAEPRIRSHS